jgi:hypothetical protein
MRHRAKMTGADVIVAASCVVLALLTLGAAGESARRLAQELVCLGNHEVLTGAWLAYADDNDGQLVRGHTDPGHWVDRPAASGSVDLQFDAIRRGLLFPYVADLNAYHCPADQTLNDPNYPVFRTYSIAGGANGESWSEYTKAKVYSDLESPATRYIFVEESSTRGINIGSWQMNPGSKTWVDPLAMWHKESTTLGFADGHAEIRRWHDPSLIDWCHRAMEKHASFLFGMTPPDDEQEDVEYMAQGFPYKSLR